MHTDHHSTSTAAAALPHTALPVQSHFAEVRSQCGHSLFAKPFPWWKRAMDVTGAACALLVFSPIMLAIAVAIKVTSPGPIFFSQRRGGMGGKAFNLARLI